jgi:hypothetical protein
MSMGHWWNNTEENAKKKSAKNSPRFILSSTDRTQNYMGSSLGLRGDKRQRTAQVIVSPFCISIADDFEYD